MDNIQHTSRKPFVFEKINAQLSNDSGMSEEAGLTAEMGKEHARFQQASECCLDFLVRSRKTSDLMETARKNFEKIFSADNVMPDQVAEKAAMLLGEKPKMKLRLAELDALQQAMDDLKVDLASDAGRQQASLMHVLALLAPAERAGGIASPAVADDKAAPGLLRAGADVAAANTPAGDTPAASTSQSLGQIWEELSKLVGQQSQNNLKHYGDALERYTDFYKKITNIIGSLGQWVTSQGENQMKVNYKKIHEALADILNSYNPPASDKTIAGPFPSREEAKAACDKLGLDPEQCIYQNADGTFSVIPDLSQVRAIKDKLPGDSDAHVMSIAQYNAWKAGFDAQTNRIEESLQARGQKYSNQFGRFETFHKTISSIIQSMADMLAKYLQF